MAVKDEELTKLLKKYYEEVYSKFILAMKDRWDNSDYDQDREYNKNIKEMENELNQFASRKDAFEIFCSSIEEVDPEMFENMKSDLDSATPGTYETLYDLMSKYNNIHKSKCVCEDYILKKIMIKY